MSNQATIQLPHKLQPVFIGKARYRGAYGGRGSAKTFNFAKMTAVWGYRYGTVGRSGNIICAREFQNSLDDSSMEEVKKAILSEPFLADYYEIGEQYIRSRDGRIKYLFAGLRRNINSVKSKSNVLLVWVDEAEPVTEYAWDILTPTVRDWGSEIWVTWNPEKDGSATDQRFRKDPPKNSKIVEMNWRDNPWFYETELPAEREHNEEKLPGYHYRWKWEGYYFKGDESTIIRSEFFGEYSVLPELKKTIVVCDTGNKPKEHNDPTAAMLAGLGKDGKIYLMDAINGHWASVEREQNVKAFYNKHRIRAGYGIGTKDIHIEDIGTGTDLIQRLEKDKTMRVHGIQRTAAQSGFNGKYGRLLDVFPFLAPEHGTNVMLPSGPIRYADTTVTDASWVSDFIVENEAFRADDSHDHDEFVDLLIDSIALLTKKSGGVDMGLFK